MGDVIFLKYQSAQSSKIGLLRFNMCGVLNVCQFFLCASRALCPYGRSVQEHGEGGHRSQTAQLGLSCLLQCPGQSPASGCLSRVGTVRPKQTPWSARLATASFTALCALTSGLCCQWSPHSSCLHPLASWRCVSPGSLAAVNTADSGLCVSIRNRECATSRTQTIPRKKQGQIKQNLDLTSSNLLSR